MVGATSFGATSQWASSLFQTLSDGGVDTAVTAHNGWSSAIDHRLARSIEAAGPRFIETRRRLRSVSDTLALLKRRAYPQALAQPFLGVTKVREIAVVDLPRKNSLSSASQDTTAAATVGGRPEGGSAPQPAEPHAPRPETTRPYGSPDPARPTADTAPPSLPGGLVVGWSTQTGLGLTWAASSDDVGVAGYGVYVDGSLVASPSSAAYALTGLSCGTSYTVAVDAFDAAGNRSGKTTVTTSTAACADSQLPTAPIGLAATFVTQAAVTLSWGGSSDNVGVAGYDLYLGAIVAATTAQTSFAFSGLSCGTTYTVGVDAYDPAGNRSAVSWLIVTTGACADTSPPTAPRNLVESAATVSAISAAWTASTDNVAVTGYRVYLDGTLAGTTAATSYTATGLSCGSSHQVVVDAYDTAGNHSAQTVATMATSACPAGPPGDTQPPTTPTALAVTSAGQTMIALNWTAASDNVGISGYGVYENGSLIASPATTGYTLLGLTCGTSYTLSVDAYDAAGNRSNTATITTSTTACPDTDQPSAPTNLALATRTTTSISITWTPSTDNILVAGYDLYLGGAAAGTATATAYTLTALTCGTNYTVGVDAYDAAGNRSAQTTTLISTAACPDTSPPTTPTSPAVTSTTQTSITLSWATTPGGAGVAGYRLYQGGVQVGASTGLSYVFSALVCGTSYSLGVSTVDASGNVSSWGTVSAATSACSSPRSTGSTSMASLWVGVGGSGSCVRSVVPVGYAAAVAGGNVCDSGPTAYARAQLGDTVLIEGGTYTSRWNFASAISKAGTPGTCDYNYRGTANLSGCVTFEPASGQAVSFQVAGTNQPQIGICADFVSIQNVTFNMTTFTDQYGDTISNNAVGIGAGDSSCMPNGAPPHDIYLAGNSYAGAAGTVGGAFNVWFVGGSATAVSGFPWQMGGEGNNGTTVGVHDSGIVGVTFQGYNFANVDPAHHHMECLHMDYTGNANTIADDRFEGCPVYSIRIEAEGPTANNGNSQTNHLIENNYFDGQNLNFDCHDPGCSITGNTVRFNSFNAASFAPTNDCALTTGNTCTVANSRLYGNLNPGCTSNAATYGLGWTPSHNVNTSAQSGICAGDTTSAYNITVTYTSPGPPNYNLSLGSAQTATNFVPSSVPGGWPTADIHATARSGAATNAGAG